MPLGVALSTHIQFVHPFIFCVLLLESLYDLYVADKLEQRPCIKFCVKLDKYAADIFEMLPQAFAEHTLGRTGVFEWHRRFRAGQDNKHSGQPIISKI